MDWQEIASDLERKIQTRQLGPGDKLPSEHALVKRYYVTRHAVRTALSNLAERGLIQSSQGRGSFVERPSLMVNIQRRTRFSENVRQARAVHQQKTLRLSVDPASNVLARKFGVRAGTPILCLERASIVNGQPSGIGTHHFLESRVPCFAEHYERTQSITATLQALGIGDYVRVQTRIIARLPTPEEAIQLDMPRHVPLIITKAINHDSEGAMLEYGEARMAADRVELVIEPEKNLI
jgi:GntR family transcriptional regulator, phosphonate transport system regulatory protein